MEVHERKRPADRLTHEHIDVLSRIVNAGEGEPFDERNALQGHGGGAAMSPGMGAERRIEHPPLGAVVVYRARTRGYKLPAIVTATIDTLDQRGVVRGDVPQITDEERVHLNVSSCGAAMMYQEFDVPFSVADEPGTWGWA